MKNNSEYIECPWCGKWLEIIQEEREQYYHCDCGYYLKKEIKE